MAPSSVFKSRGLVRWPLAAAAAALVFTLGLTVPAGPAIGQAGGIDRSVIPIAADAPERYVVVRGDTLWDISARFLRDPWYWPEIWYINPQVENPHLIYPGDVLVLTWVDGRPRVMLERGGAVRLSPRVREEPLSEAIRAIPWEIVEAFMSKPTVLTKEQVESAPYVVTGMDGRTLAATGDDVYMRRMDDAVVGSRWLLYNVQNELRDPDDGDVLGYKAIYTATGRVERAGAPATVRILANARETANGDVGIPETVEVNKDFIPRPPEGEIDGTIMDVVDMKLAFAEYTVVVINRGAQHGLEPGNVLSIWRAGETVADETPHRESSKVTLPDEMVGRFMVFKAFDRLSFGLVLEATNELRLGYQVRRPE